MYVAIVAFAVIYSTDNICLVDDDVSIHIDYIAYAYDIIILFALLNSMPEICNY